MKLLLCENYLYEILPHGVIVYVVAKYDDMPMLFALGKHWQSIGGWNI